VIPGPSAPFACEPIDRARAAALGELFDRAGSACHCQYWHFTGDKNEWQARLAFEPGANRRALFERAIRSPPRGVVAVLSPSMPRSGFWLMSWGTLFTITS
jgi:hypothetical protein